MRNLHFLWILLLACALSAQQPAAGAGLTPKTGAIFDNVYANVFFNFNFRFPQDWDVAFVAPEGPCAPECMLLEVRAPGYPKPPRSISINAEAGAHPDHLASAALILEKSGARKLSGLREITDGPRKMYRADYRSHLVDADLYHAFIAIPEKDYLVVFTFAAENRKLLDALAGDITHSLTFLNAKSTSP
jgi:hypothetical protein